MIGVQIGNVAIMLWDFLNIKLIYGEGEREGEKEARAKKLLAQ